MANSQASQLLCSVDNLSNPAPRIRIPSAAMHLPAQTMFTRSARH